MATSFLLTTQSLHTFIIAQIISGFTIILIQIHEHKATALGFGAFCARHFSKYDKRQGTQLLQFIRISFQKQPGCHLIKQYVKPRKIKQLNDKRRNTVKEKLMIKMLG